MAESVAVKADISFRRREFRKRILRMLVSISSNRSKRFDFSNDIQPGLNATAIGETPALQRKSNLQGVEQRNIEHGHEPVVTRVIQISQRVQVGDTDGRRQAVGEKTRLQLLEHRRFKLFDFNPTKKREGIEIFMRVAHAAKIFSRRWRARDVMMPLISRRRTKGVHITLNPKASAATLRTARAAAHQRPSCKPLSSRAHAMSASGLAAICSLSPVTARSSRRSRRDFNSATAAWRLLISSTSA